MRRTVGTVLVVTLAVALATWMRFSSNQLKSTAPPAEASITTIIPDELMRNSGKELPDKTVPEPF
jgi:hypothetical protein